MASPTLPKFPFMILEGKRWSARLDVPKDAREQIGQRVLKFSTGLTDPFQAYKKAEPVIAGWRRQIETARGQRDTSMTSACRRSTSRGSTPPDSPARKRRLG